jgi:hypothetical protein
VHPVAHVALVPLHANAPHVGLPAYVAGAIAHVPFVAPDHPSAPPLQASQEPPHVVSQQ